MRGHSGSGHTPGAYRLHDYAGDVHEFITKLIGEPAIIYGHSLGALVATGLAALHPEDVRCLVLSDPPLYYHDTLTRDTFWLQEFQELYDFVLAHPDPVEMDAWLAQNFPNMPPERRQERVLSLQGIDPGLIRAIRDDELMADAPLVEMVPRVRCPVLLLRGDPELDSALRPQDVEFARGAFPSIRLLEVKGSGHNISLLPLLPEIFGFIDSACGNENS
jgi:pimeloyl-ACP methyl ester carboxylesterase